VTSIPVFEQNGGWPLSDVSSWGSCTLVHEGGGGRGGGEVSTGALDYYGWMYASGEAAVCSGGFCFFDDLMD